MNVNKYIPYSLRRAFAYAANIPAAVGFLPFIPFASKSGNDTPVEAVSLVATTAALAFGLAAAPVATLCVATPLWFVGRIMQALTHEYQPLPYRLLDVDIHANSRLRDALRR